MPEDESTDGHLPSSPLHRKGDGEEGDGILASKSRTIGKQCRGLVLEGLVGVGIRSVIRDDIW